jgi:cell division topological specificity factor
MSTLLAFIKKRLNRPNTAQMAKERLQIIVAHERLNRGDRKDGGNLQELQQKLIDMVAEFLGVDKAQVNVELQRDKNRSVLELNVTMPDRV